MHVKHYCLCLFFVATLVSLPCYGADPCMIKLDINYRTNNDDANTQAGFTKFIIANSGSEVNGVAIDLGGNIQSARRTDPCGTWSGGVYYPRAGERLYRDFIYGVQPSGVTITLWGLGTNRDCNVTIWAYDACSTGDVNRVANWYSNGTHIFDTNFIGGPVGWPGYEAQRPQDLYKWAWHAKVTTDNLGRIILTSSRGPSSPAGQDFAFVNALVVEPNILTQFVPTKYAHRPVPFDGNEGVPVNVVLKWRKGDGVVKHDLYLGDDATKVADATRASHPGVLIYAPDLAADANAGYDPYGAAGLLELDKTYYWRIDEVNAAPDYTIFKGEVWSFKTLPNFVVDNFNSYVNNDALWTVWKDGYENGTASEVFLETVIVHDGNSMEYMYKNYNEPYYSEADATMVNLGMDPNWLGMGAKSLVLWFYGQLNNDANEQMYIKLTDSGMRTAKVLYDGNRNDLRQQWWHEWNIALQDFVDDNPSFDLRNVGQITIGFGDGVEPVGLGAGTMYFEDIQIYATRCVLAKRSADFARVDYASYPGGDCIVDYRELKLMADEWLNTRWWDFEPPTPPWPPSIPNLVAYWPMNEGDGNKIYTDPCDPNWTGTMWNNGTTPPGYHGTTWASPGYNGTGTCVYLDGSQGARVSCGNKNPAEPNGQITLAVWIKWFGPRNDPYLWNFTQGIIGKRGGWSDDRMMFMFVIAQGNGGAYALRHYITGSGDVQDVYTGNILNSYIGQWVHIAATFDGTTAKLYFNGGVVASGPFRFSTGTDAYLTIGNTMDINAWPDSPESFYGDLDEVCIYNRALTEDEIVYLADYSNLFPIFNEVNLYNDGWEFPQVINFKDFAVLANYWLKESLWP